MYTNGNKIVADAGEELSLGNIYGFSFENSPEVQSSPINNISVSGIFINLGHVGVRYYKNWTYAQWKAYLIKLKYSNDDQIAIMLNKDRSEQDMTYYNKMQEWRDWAGQVASQLINM